MARLTGMLRAATVGLGTSVGPAPVVAIICEDLSSSLERGSTNFLRHMSCQEAHIAGAGGDLVALV